jgi:hypothetical protein
MLTHRIARYAQRKGVQLPTGAGLLQAAMAGTIAVVETLPIQLSERARAQLSELGLEEEALTGVGDTHARLWFRDDQARRVLREPGSSPEGCGLLLSRPRCNALLEPGDGALRVAWVSKPKRAEGMRLLLARFVITRDPGYDATPLLRLVASIADVESERERDRKFIQPYQEYLRHVSQHIWDTRPSVPYDVIGRSPLRIITKGRWPAEFADRWARVELPLEQSRYEAAEDGREQTWTFTVASMEEAGAWLEFRQDDDPERRVAASGLAVLRPDLRPYDRMLEALAALVRGADPSHLSLLEIVQNPASLPPCEVREVETTLLGPPDEENARQRQAVALALACPDLCVIQGPPGTGKTTVISELVMQLTRRRQRVLLVAPTNVALDNVLEHVGHAEGVVALRLGFEDRTDPQVHEFLVEHRAASLARTLKQNLDRALEGVVPEDPLARVQRDWRAGLDQFGDTLGRLLLLEANLVCATPIGLAMAREFEEPELTFDVMIIDEASKATVADFLVPATRARRWIIVGDHLQLAPYLDLDDVQGVIQQRLRPPPSDEQTERLSGLLRKHFEQRMQPDPARQKRAWRELVEMVVKEEPALVSLFGEASGEHELRQLASRLKARASESGAPEDEQDLLIAGLPVAARQKALEVCRSLSELLTLERVAMPSILESLIQRGLPAHRMVRLDVQFRMAPELAAFSGRHVYHGDYRSARHTEHLKMLIPTLEAPAIWIDTATAPPMRRYELPRDRAWDSGKFRNPLEEEVVLEVLEECLRWAERSWRGDAKGGSRRLLIGVLSFYQEQARHLRNRVFQRFAQVEQGKEELGEEDEAKAEVWRMPARRLAANDAPIDLHVSVVDRFQGQDKDIVILPFTRSNPAGVRGHVNNLNRLNVAATRARYKRIIIGDVSTLVMDGCMHRSAEDLLVRLHEGCEVKQVWGSELGRRKRER